LTCVTSLAAGFDAFDIPSNRVIRLLKQIPPDRCESTDDTSHVPLIVIRENSARLSSSSSPYSTTGIRILSYSPTVFEYCRNSFNSLMEALFCPTVTTPNSMRFDHAVHATWKPFLTFVLFVDLTLTLTLS
jgi:hypothetical protein